MTPHGSTKSFNGLVPFQVLGSGSIMLDKMAQGVVTRWIAAGRRQSPSGARSFATADKRATTPNANRNDNGDWKRPPADNGALLEQTKLGERKYPKFTAFPYLVTSPTPAPLFRTGNKLLPNNRRLPVADRKVEFENFEQTASRDLTVPVTEQIATTWLCARSSLECGTDFQARSPNVPRDKSSQMTLWWQFYVRGENPDYPMRRQAFDYLWQRGVNVYALSMRDIENWTRWVEIRKQCEFLQMQKQRPPFHPRFPYAITFERKLAMARRLHPRTDPLWIQLQRTTPRGRARQQH